MSMNNLISKNIVRRIINSPRSREEMLQVLESVQSVEIVTCEKCKYGIHAGRGDTYLCVVSPEERGEHKYDFWCAYGDRREEW